MLPELKAKVSLTDKRLTIHFNGKDKHFKLTDGCINLFEIDDYMTSVFHDKYEKELLSLKLQGKA